MDEEIAQLGRRLRRRERRLLRRLEIAVPIAFVALALLLSAGVVVVMEDPPPAEAAPARTAGEAIGSAPGSSGPRVQAPVATRPELQSMLSTSVLGDEIEGVPEPGTAGPADDAPAPPAQLEGPTGDAAGAQLRLRRQPTVVPQPGTGVLLASGLVWIGVIRRGRDAKSDPATGRSDSTKPRSCSTKPRSCSTKPRSYWMMSRSSTSNVSAAPGGIAGGAPLSP